MTNENIVFDRETCASIKFLIEVKVPHLLWNKGVKESCGIRYTKKIGMVTERHGNRLDTGDKMHNNLTKITNRVSFVC